MKIKKFGPTEQTVYELVKNEAERQGKIVVTTDE